MASQKKSDGRVLADKDHKCFNAFLERNFEYKNHVADYYTKVAPEYDQFMRKTDYNGPRIVAAIVNDLIAEKSSWLVDICGGTGISGQEVSKYGFTNIDYIDGSDGMAKQAKLKGIYRNYYCEMLRPGKQSSLETEKYDCVFSVGSYVPGHLQPEMAHEYIRILKKGGLCVIGMREQWLHEAEDYKDKLEPHMYAIKSWKLLSRTVMDNWYNEYSGLVYVFQKL
uniref:Methyltransf_25 domain-containing protein n=1 Tax=Trichuris muris TaxID=70415 RepID=A0A5S6QC96_TRIMR